MLIFLIVIIVGGLLLYFIGMVFSGLGQLGTGIMQNKINRLQENTQEIYEANRLTGACPYCQSSVKAPPPIGVEQNRFVHPQGFDCPACNKRIIIREEKFTAMT